MSSDLLIRIQNAMKVALKAKDAVRLTTIRMLLADIKRFEKDNKIQVVTDPEIFKVLDKFSKQRRDSITQFKQANRQDLVAKEQAELDVISEFLPAKYSEDELNGLIQNAITVVEAKTIKDLGKVMSELQPKIVGRADSSLVVQMVRTALQSV